MQNLISGVIHYPTKYKTQQGRLIYIVFSRYGKFSYLAKVLKVSRQFINILLKEERLPLQYATSFGKRHKLSPGLFNYNTYLHVNIFDAPDTYEELLDRNCEFFDEAELTYIYKGKKMESKKEFLETVL